MKSIITKTSVSILRAKLYQPFRTALGQHDTLENILFKMELHNGTVGFGEAAIATHITGETIPLTLKNLENVGESLIGRDAADYLKISAYLNERLPRNKSAVAAIETALLDAFTRQRGIPLWKLFGGGALPRHDSWRGAPLLTTDITIVIADLKETESTAKKYYRQGFRTFKVKIGRDKDLDLKRVSAVHKITKGSPIYLDANQGYSAKETLSFIKELKRFKMTPALIEQPVAKNDWAGLKEVSRRTTIPVCADESVSSIEDLVKLIRQKSAGAVNVKLMKFGLINSWKIALLARAGGLKLMIGGMMESSLAMTTSAHLACGLGFFDYIDLDTPFFMKKDPFHNPYLNQKGVYDLRKVRAGVGLTHD